MRTYGTPKDVQRDLHVLAITRGARVSVLLEEALREYVARRLDEIRR